MRHQDEIRLNEIRLEQARFYVVRAMWKAKRNCRDCVIKTKRKIKNKSTGNK